MGVAAIIGIFVGVMSLIGALKNFDQQQQQFQYTKDVQQQIFSREDTSVQRRVQDLKAAGLSPVLAAGQGANAGQAVQTQAPQIDVNAISGMTGINAANTMSDSLKKQQDIAGTQMSIELMKEQMMTQRTQQLLNKANASKSYWQSAIDAYELGLAKKPGVSTKGGLATDIIKSGTGISAKNMPPIVTDVSKTLNKGWDMYNKMMDSFWNNNFRYNNKPIFGGK